MSDKEVHDRILCSIERIGNAIHDDLVDRGLLPFDEEQKPDLVEGFGGIILDELPFILRQIAGHLEAGIKTPLRYPIDEMFFSVRSSSLLAQVGIETLEGLSRWTAAELQEVGFPLSALTEVRSVLVQHGLALTDQPPGGPSRPGQ